MFIQVNVEQTTARFHLHYLTHSLTHSLNPIFAPFFFKYLAVGVFFCLQLTIDDTRTMEYQILKYTVHAHTHTH